MKLITKYEVEGCWTSGSRTVYCRKCGSRLEAVPKKGHFNSKYWELQRDDGLFLKCCPKGCSECSGVEAFRAFIKVREWCTAGSTTWRWSLDYAKIDQAWIDRSGKLYPVARLGHADFATYHKGLDERDLEVRGWIKITGVHYFMYDSKLKPSERQLDTLFEYAQVRNCSAHKTIDEFNWFVENTLKR